MSQHYIDGIWSIGSFFSYLSLNLCNELMFFILICILPASVYLAFSV